MSVSFWHTPEVFGGAAIPSGNRVTFTVPLSKAACGLLTQSCLWLRGLVATQHRVVARVPKRSWKGEMPIAPGSLRA